LVDRSRHSTLGKLHGRHPRKAPRRTNASRRPRHPVVALPRARRRVPYLRAEQLSVPKGCR
jgi:hypothetical protein